MAEAKENATVETAITPIEMNFFIIMPPSFFNCSVYQMIIQETGPVEKLKIKRSNYNRQY